MIFYNLYEKVKKAIISEPYKKTIDILYLGDGWNKYSSNVSCQGASKIRKNTCLMIFHDFNENKIIDRSFKDKYKSYIGWWMEQILIPISPSPHPHPRRQQTFPARGQTNKETTFDDFPWFLWFSRCLPSSLRWLINSVRLDDSIQFLDSIKFDASTNWIEKRRERRALRRSLQVTGEARRCADSSNWIESAN